MDCTFSIAKSPLPGIKSVAVMWTLITASEEVLQEGDPVPLTERLVLLFPGRWSL